MSRIKRIDLERKVAELKACENLPSWAREPHTELEFAAAVICRTPGVTPVYDQNSRLVAYRGIALKPQRRT